MTPSHGARDRGHSGDGGHSGDRSEQHRPFDQEATEPLDAQATQPLDAQATEALSGDRTEVLDAQATRPLDAQRTEALAEDRTEVLSGDRTEVLESTRYLDDDREVYGDHATQVLEPGWVSPQGGQAGGGSGVGNPDPQGFQQAAGYPAQQAPSGYPGGYSGGQAAGAGHAAGAGYAPAGMSLEDLQHRVRSTQRAYFGRVQLIPGLIGWVVAMSAGAFLTWLGGILVTAFGSGQEYTGPAGTTLYHLIGAGQGQTAASAAVVTWGVVLVCAWFLAFLAGGFAAGRSARFSGAKQGLGVWLWLLMGTAVATVITLVTGVGSEEALTGSIQALGDGSWGWGFAAVAALLVIALIAAPLGGAWGTRYHRRADDVGFGLR